ncbi:unnamed protein product [Microthlaspi erraticum]|uniref:Uncharacterized protein n=1 Tax=Microthlaspi erraticum TaxID=1685480 RepID=A0A6D2HV17_9BRAS|nr:unnamed protein product [Microthlaspi erraticum]
MSRKGVIKRVKTGPDGLSSIAPNRAHRLAENEHTTIVLRKHPRSIPPSPRPSSRTDPGSIVPRSAVQPATTSRARPRRANREAISRPRTTTSRGRSHRPTRKASHVRPEPSANPSISDPTAERKLSATIDPTVPIADHDPIVPTDRPNVRSTRSPFEARFTRFQRPGLTLSRL